MIYRNVGNTGLRISAVSYGNWITGEDKDNQQTQIELVKAAYDAGVNYFDTAESYGSGVAETLFGNAIKALNCNRNDLVIGTKLFWGSSAKFPKVNSTGLSRKHLVEGMKDSLKRLQLDYVDIVFCHRYDLEVELEDICRSMSYLVD